MIKAGIIGLGGIANSVHLPALRHLNTVKLAAACDLIPEKTRETAKAYGIPSCYTSHLEMLSREDLDCAFVLVPPDQTFRIAHDCLQHGLHLMIEKPAGITAFQTGALLRLAEERDRIVLVGMNRRYIPLVRRVLERFGQLSDIHHVECTFLKHSDASFYGGCESAYICDTIHSIDLLSYIADSDPQNAATLIDTIDSPIDNSWNSIIRFRNGRTGILKGGYRSGGRIHTVEIHGSCASAYLNLGFGGAECSAKILHHEGTSSFSLSSAGAATYNIEAFDGKEIAGSGEYWNYYGYLAEDRDFIDSILSGRQPLSGLKESCRSMLLAQFILEHKL